VLERIFEPSFSEYSHAFRPKRGCHTALRMIKYEFNNIVWGIEADICFDMMNREVLLNCLKKRIQCDKTLA